MKKNLGEVIERTVRRSGISITEIAKRLKVNRRTVYYWFKQESLHYYTIQEIGAVIGHDFTKELLDHSDENNSGIPDIYYLIYERQVLKELNYWKRKYEELSEKYTEQLMNYNPSEEDKQAADLYSSSSA